MRIHYLQHVPFEDLADIEPWAEANGHTISNTALYASESLPSLDEVDWLIVMGGPMGVHDEKKYPWLGLEKAFVRGAIDADKLVLGICLGAQLIADVLGAEVRKNGDKEVGWFPVSLTGEAASVPLLNGLTETFMAFHWHGDTFGIPEGAVHIAKSTACPNQGFTFKNKVLGLQFHLETSEAAAERLMHHCPEDLSAGAYSQSAEEIRNNFAHIPEMRSVMTTLLENMEAQAS